MSLRHFNAAPGSLSLSSFSFFNASHSVHKTSILSVFCRQPLSNATMTHWATTHNDSVGDTEPWPFNCWQSYFKRNSSSILSCASSSAECMTASGSKFASKRFFSALDTASWAIQPSFKRAPRHRNISFLHPTSRRGPSTPTSASALPISPTSRRLKARHRWVPCRERRFRRVPSPDSKRRQTKRTPRISPRRAWAFVT